MSVSESVRRRMLELLQAADDSPQPTLAPTLLFNEGWLLRLTLDWFARHPDASHELAVPAGIKWFSEALLPSRFKPIARGDGRGESRTHADAVIGDVRLDDATARGLLLTEPASQFVVVEAKLGSGLSKGTRNAAEYGQAARNVACMAETLASCTDPPSVGAMSRLAFYVVAPLGQITKARIDEALDKEAIRRAVEDRARAFPEHHCKDWLIQWFDPMLQAMRIDALAWEHILEFIAAEDGQAGADLRDFYASCLRHNRLEPAPAQRSQGPRRIVEYVRRLPDFEMAENSELPYRHMGATITDGVLQAGLRYETVVWPRVQHVMAIPEAATSTGFLAALRGRGGEEVVRWTHPEKLGRMYAVSELFIAEGIETEDDLHSWLCLGSSDSAQARRCAANAARLLAVHGIGPKTVDYFKILCGEQDTAAIDLHLTAFLERAGVRVTSYEQAREVIREAAAELGVPAAQLDHSIWTHMSKAGRTW